MKVYRENGEWFLRKNRKESQYLVDSEVDELASSLKTAWPGKIKLFFLPSRKQGNGNLGFYSSSELI